MKLATKCLFMGMAIASMTGCTTPFQPSGLAGGYSSFQLNENTFQVSFRGNGFTSEELVRTYLLCRAAQITQQQGYNYFIILQGGTIDNTSSFSTPTTVTTNGYGNYNASVYGNQANINGWNSSYSTIQPGQNIIVHKYKDTIIIKLLRSNKGYPEAFNASIILSQMNIKK